MHRENNFRLNPAEPSVFQTDHSTNFSCQIAILLSIHKSSPHIAFYRLQSLHHTPSHEAASTMAEAAPGVPTFKLVLVGDGGTGKVRNLCVLHPFDGVDMGAHGP